MSKFKVGDTVRLVDDNHHRYKKGHEFVVRGIDAADDLWTMGYWQGECVHPWRCELVERVEPDTCTKAEPALDQEPNAPPCYKYPQYQMHLVDMLGGVLYSEEYPEPPTEADAVDRINREVSDDEEKVLVVVYKPHKVFLVNRTVTVEQVEGAD